VFYAGCISEFSQAKRGGEIGSDRLFAVDVFAGGNSSFDGGSTEVGELCVKVERVRRISECGSEICGPASDVVLSCNLLELVCVAADEDWVGKQHGAVV